MTMLREQEIADLNATKEEQIVELLAEVERLSAIKAEFDLKLLE